MSRRAGVLVVVMVACAAGEGSAARLDSPVLTLEVTEAPYSYRVVERATGQPLVVSSATTFTGGGAVASAAGVTSTATTLEADLVLAGGEKAHVRFAFTSPEVLEVLLTRPGAIQIQEQFQDQQERYYGVWEYPWGGRLDNRGQDHPFLGVGQNTGSLYTSGRAPFYLTSRRYGIYAQTTTQGRYAIATGGTTGFTFDGASLRYHVIYGPGYLEVLQRYAALAGGPALPPLWALDTIYWSDDFHQDLHNASNAQGNVVDLATQLQAHRIRASGILVDRPYGTGDFGWGNMDFDSQFPDPTGLRDQLATRGLHLVLWVANRAWNGLYTEGQTKGYLFSASQNTGPAVDLRNQAAYDWLKGKLDPLAQLARGYKIDRGEQGEHPDAVQNENVTLFAKLTREGLVTQHGDDVFVIARNVSDTGRKYTAVWNGDSRADFTGLGYSVAAGLRSGMVMMPAWGSDTGGYLRGGGLSEEVFARWYGFSAFSPVMEVLIGQGHTPWYDYSTALVDIARKHGDTHHDLMPYTRSFLYAATKSGAPVMRPLFLGYPDDPTAAGVSDQYLYGTELLVAPVLQAGATGRAVYLPPGKWLDYNRRLDVIDGGATVQAAAPLDTIPVYVREGAIIPRGDLHRGNDNWTPGWTANLRVEVFPSATLASRFDYYTGSAVQTITAAKASGRITIQLGDLGAPGKLEVYLAGLSGVTRNGAPLSPADYRFDGATHVLSVPFTGATTLLIHGAVSLFGPGNEAAPDAGIDAGFDAAADAGPPDAALDVALSPDAAAGVTPDAPLPADAAVDRSPDLARDAAADRRPDTAPDLASEVLPATDALIPAVVADAAAGDAELSRPGIKPPASAGCSCQLGGRPSAGGPALLLAGMIAARYFRRRRSS